VGGIWNSVYLGGYVFTMMFSYNLMMSSIIGKLYSFNTKFASEKTKESQKEKKKKKKGKDKD
jgi:mannose/fructose/N-acetylgalactosamine-specific phosphotransferase system component IIC